MWHLGLGARTSSIERPAPPPPLAPLDRNAIEETVMLLHAGCVAERLLRPRGHRTCAGPEHERIHQLMAEVESSGPVTIAWCDYAWQRAYAWMSTARSWTLIVALARALRRYGTLDGAFAAAYLQRIADACDGQPPPLPHTGAERSPWHREWPRPAAPPRGKPTTLPERIEAVMAETELALLPIAETLALSARAEICLAEAGIRTARDLTARSERELARIRGMGRTIFSEIVAAAKRAGIELASHPPS